MNEASVAAVSAAVSAGLTAPAGEGAARLSPYRVFRRDEWAHLRADTPMTLDARAVARLQ